MEDVSKTTIAILLVLAVIISVIGTWVVLNTVTLTQKPPTQQMTQAQGNLRLTVLNPSQPATSTESQANIKLEVVRPG